MPPSFNAIGDKPAPSNFFSVSLGTSFFFQFQTAGFVFPVLESYLHHNHYIIISLYLLIFAFSLSLSFVVDER